MELYWKRAFQVYEKINCVTAKGQNRYMCTLRCRYAKIQVVITIMEILSMLVSSILNTCNRALTSSHFSQSLSLSDPGLHVLVLPTELTDAAHYTKPFKRLNIWALTQFTVHFCPLVYFLLPKPYYCTK